MNVLMVGGGKGSFEMRGRQLGNAIGARVTSAPTASDWGWAEIAVLIKRAGVRYAPEAHRAGVPIIWDALDFWSQPYENGLDETRALALLAAQLTIIKPALTIGATQAMADACGGVYLPHHSWSGLLPQRPREQVRVVAYQGNPVYLGKWRGVLVSACQARGWAFVTMLEDVRDLWVADLFVAFRDGPWDGWMCRAWKSGVKIANAQAAGRPIIAQASASASEINAPGWVVSSEEAVGGALDALADYRVREVAYEACLKSAPAYRLPAVAERFGHLLSNVVKPCAA